MTGKETFASGSKVLSFCSLSLLRGERGARKLPVNQA
jgi:hypothetical protein